MDQFDNLRNVIDLDYDLLTKPGNLGFYRSCEATTIFLFNNVTKQAHNYFTIMVFEEREKETEEVEYLTEKLITISSEFKMGICRYDLTMEQALDSFRQIKNSQVLYNIGGDLQIGNLDLINKQFVPQDGTVEVRLNKALKNNFINGSYIYEFFDTYKSFMSILSKRQREQISNLVMKFVPINLHVLQDRIGNIIFQFPSTLLSLKSSSGKDETSLDITLYTDKRIDSEDRYGILVTNEFDNCITGIRYHDNKNSKKIILEIGDTGNLIKTMVYDKKTDLVVYEANYSFIKHIYTRFHIGSEFPEYRTIITSNGKAEVDVEPVEFMEIPRRNMSEHKKYWKEFVKERQYKERLEELEHRMKFMQYGTSQMHTRRA